MVAVPKLTALGKESSGTTSHSKGVVAVPRDMPKALSLPCWYVGDFRFSEHKHSLAEYLPRGLLLDLNSR